MLKPKCYYKVGDRKVSSLDFKILNISQEISLDTISDSLRKYINGKAFYVHPKRSQDKSVIFSMLNKRSIYDIKKL